VSASSYSTESLQRNLPAPTAELGARGPRRGCRHTQRRQHLRHLRPVVFCPLDPRGPGFPAPAREFLPGHGGFGDSQLACAGFEPGSAGGVGLQLAVEPRGSGHRPTFGDLGTGPLYIRHVGSARKDLLVPILPGNKLTDAPANAGEEGVEHYFGHKLGAPLSLHRGGQALRTHSLGRFSAPAIGHSGTILGRSRDHLGTGSSLAPSTGGAAVAHDCGWQKAGVE
jgi:hypothetical protein